MLYGLALPSGVAHAQRVEVGQPAPPFELASLQGTQVSLAQHRGHPVVINFWASWCTPCRTELPALIAAWSQPPAGRFEVLAINLTDQEIRSHIQPFVTAMGMTFPVLLDERGRVRGHYMLRGVPTTVFIDSSGTIRLIHPGPITPDALAHGLALIVPAAAPAQGNR